MSTLTSALPVVAFHIYGYKNEREGVKIEMDGIADDCFFHSEAHNSIANTIARILKKYELSATDIISISVERDLNRDTGSNNFWMFVRNPDFLEA